MFLFFLALPRIGQWLTQTRIHNARNPIVGPIQNRVAFFLFLGGEVGMLPGGIKRKEKEKRITGTGSVGALRGGEGVGG